MEDDEEYKRVAEYCGARMSRAQLFLKDGEELHTKRANKTLALRCGRVIDGRNVWGEGHAEKRKQGQCVVVLITGCFITKVGWEGEVEIPEGAKVQDFSRYTVLPGLIDCHFHPLNASENYQIAHIKSSSADMLYCGWTSVRVAGDLDLFYGQFDIRTAIQEGMFVGPRICGAGHYLSITGGGGDMNDLAPEQCRCAPDGKIVDGVDDMRKAVRQEIKYGSDWIKLLVTGAYMSLKDNPLSVHFSSEELSVAVSEAERLGRHVMAHAHSAEGIKQAVLAGVRSIEHGSFIDDECVRLMKERGTWLVPTQYIGEYYLENASANSQLTKMIDIQKKTDSVSIARLKRAVASGVKVALGSDGPGWPLRQNVLEMRCLVQQLGMTELQAIVAATSSAAELLEWDDKLGTIEEGKLADIIAVEGDPLSDITAMQNVRAVILNGKVVKRGKLHFT